MSYQKVIMIGNLVEDPTLRYTTSGKAVCNFRIAVNEREETLFIGVTTWEKQADNCSQYLTKGKQVLVEGKLVERTWGEGKEKRSKMEITAYNVRFLGGKQDTPPDEITDVEPF